MAQMTHIQTHVSIHRNSYFIQVLYTTYITGPISCKHDDRVPTASGKHETKYRTMSLSSWTHWVINRKVYHVYAEIWKAQKDWYMSISDKVRNQFLRVLNIFCKNLFLSLNVFVTLSGIFILCFMRKVIYSVEATVSVTTVNPLV